MIVARYPEPNRSGAQVASLKYDDGDNAVHSARPRDLPSTKRLLMPGEMTVCAPVRGKGISLPLRAIPLGTSVHNIDIWTTGRGCQVRASAGQTTTLTALEAGYCPGEKLNAGLRAKFVRIHERGFATMGTSFGAMSILMQREQSENEARKERRGIANRKTTERALVW